MKRALKMLVVLTIALSGIVMADEENKGNRMNVLVPELDRDAIRAEKEWQRSKSSEYPRVTREWNWLAMNDADLFAHALPVLEANVDLCGEQLLLVPDGEDGEKTVCNFVPFITEAPIPNAFTDGSLVFFTKGMLRAIHNADEFRAVLGHEVGHVLAGHLEKKLRNAKIGAVFGALVGAGIAAKTDMSTHNAASLVYDMAYLGNWAGMKYNKKYEREADYIGAYILARSGGNVDAAANMWRRWGEGAKGSFLGSHPTEAERFVLLRTTASEISGKYEDGLEIVPNLKPKRR